MGSVLVGPWRTNLTGPLAWFASVNDGISAFQVQGRDLKAAVSAAYVALHERVMADVDPRDPFALDTAEQALLALAERLQVYTPEDWTARCLRDHHARTAPTQQVGGAA